MVGLFLLAVAVSGLRAGVPEGYYDGVEGLSGGDLKQTLHQIIRRDHRFNLSTHTVIPYGDVWSALREIWRDPENPENILLVYSPFSVGAFAASWNREHLWPRSRGVGQEGADFSDLFHVVPADASVNDQRGNRYFDLSDPADPSYLIPAHPAAPQASMDGDSWQPPPDQRGDIARAMFYMEVRYNGSDPATTDLQLVSFPPTGDRMANLNTLLLWHVEDPPDEIERTRNNLIYANYQGNRNPFVDRPELVEAIWGSGVPGDPLNAPLARVAAVGATASESPPSPARLVISLNQFAGPSGIVVGFVLSGTADLDEFVLGGDVISYDEETGFGEVLVEQGYATALILVTPLDDGIEEEPETVVLTLVAGEGYDFTPDASSTATVTLRDTPSLPVFWNFDSVSATDLVLPANSGSGYASLSGWTGTVANFDGPSGDGKALSLVGQDGNGSWIDFHFSMSGYRDLSLSFATRGTNTGFDTGLWSFSTDGANFTTLTGINTATRNTTFLTRSVDFSPFASLNNAAEVVVRYTLSGATSDSGNNRIDNLVFNATALVTGDALREVSALAQTPEANPVTGQPGVFALRLNGLAPIGGLEVVFSLGGTADAANDYLVTGEGITAAGAGLYRIFFPQDEDTVFVGIAPQPAAGEGPLRTVVLSLPEPSEEIYLVGPSRTAVVTLPGDGTVVTNDYFTRLFTSSAPFDLAGRSITFTPIAGGNLYIADIAPATRFPVDIQGGTPLVLSDDAFATVTLGGGRQVRLYGLDYSTFHVGSNGYLTFGAGDTAWSPSLSRHFDRPRVSPLFVDLNPADGGQISWQQTDDRVAVSYVDVPRFSVGDRNSFQVEMFFDGRIRLTYLQIDAVAAANVVVGLSRGLGTPADFAASNFTSYTAAAITSAPTAAARVGSPFTYRITASGGPSGYTAAPLPEGLALNAVTGEITGVAAQAGDYDIVIGANYDGGGAVAGQLGLTVQAADRPINDWLGGELLEEETLRRYAIGGGAGPREPGQAPIITKVEEWLSLTAVVREDDPALRVAGERVDDLTGLWSTNEVTVRGRLQGVSQAGVGPGFERREYAVPVDGAERRFLRLRVELEE